MNDVKSADSFEPRRELGRTGFRASVIGIGDIADRSVPSPECVATLRRALDAGLNVIDTAPGYEEGYSEEIVGAAVSAGARDGIFVIDKIDNHCEPVAPQVDGSLTRLGMEAVDAFVFHGVSTIEGWRRIAEAGGPMDELGGCVRAGKGRFRGISSHHPEVLLEAIASGMCDIVMFAVGPYCDLRYIDDVLPAAKAARVGTVCFKAFGAGKLLGDTAGYGKPLQARPRGKMGSGGKDTGRPALPCLTVEECVRYALTCDPDVALLGMSFPNEQDAALSAAARFEPMSREEMAAVRARAARAVAGKGECWWNPGQ